MLALEGTPVHANSAVSVSSMNIGPFTTSNPALLVIVNFINAGPVISSITGGGLTWTQRASVANGAFQFLEEWTAQAAGALTNVTFTITYTFNCNFSTADLFAISGHDAAATFDPDVSVPATGITDPLTISTGNADDFIVGVFAMGSQTTPTEGSGWTKISGADYQLTEYKIVSASQTNLSVSIGTGVGDANRGIADAVRMMADATAERGLKDGRYYTKPYGAQGLRA